MKYFEIEAPSVDDAINKFVMENDIPKEYIEYDVLEEGTKGFLGFGKKNYLVKIYFNDKEYYKRKAKLILSEILEKSGFDDCRIEVIDNHSEYVLNIFSKDSNLIIGKMAQTLNALQFLLDKMLGIDDDSDLKIVVDVENYRSRVVKHLTEKAQKLAEQVKKTGKTQKMASLVTIIRKEIHIALKNTEGVRTESYGNGNVKTVFIVPDKPKKKRNNNAV
jgi:spoIIIJ-associated protein